MFLSKLNGWLRLYISFFVLWAAFTTFSFFYNLPDRSDVSTLEQQGLLELISKIERIQKISPVEDLFKASDQVCEAAYEKGGINKNECMEFMLNSKTIGLTSSALMRARIVSSSVDERVLELKQQEDDVFYSAISVTWKKYVRQLLVLPLSVLLLGYVVAWIRRGFQLGR